MDDNEPFEKFCREAQDLWPRCKMTAKQLRVHWGNVLARHSPAAVSCALTKCISEFPDDSAPKWSKIFSYLGHQVTDKRTDGSEVMRPGYEWHQHLQVYRRNNETDERVWFRMLEEQARGITHSMVLDGTEGSVRLGRNGYSFKERPSGRCTACEANGDDCGLTELACRAKRWPDEERERWRDYLEEHNEPIPAFLRDGYGERTTFVEPQPSNTLF